MNYMRRFFLPKSIDIFLISAQKSYIKTIMWGIKFTKIVRKKNLWNLKIGVLESVIWGQHVSFLTCVFDSVTTQQNNLKVQKAAPTGIFTLSIVTDRTEQTV